MSKPTLGRLVIFQASQTSQMETAIVANVHKDGTLNLGIFDGNGRPYATPPRNVPFIDAGEDLPETGAFCRWPEDAQANPPEVASDQPGDQGGQHKSPATDGTDETGAGADADKVGSTENETETAEA